MRKEFGASQPVTGEHRPALSPMGSKVLPTTSRPKGDRSVPVLICDCKKCSCEDAMDCVFRECKCCGQSLNGAHR